MTTTGGPDTATAQAQALLSAPPETPAAALLARQQPAAEAPSPLALAWALKAECYAAWNVAPARAARGAALLQALHTQHPGAELQAVAAWCAGIAALTQGHSDEAVQQLDAARAAFIACGQPLHAAQTCVPKVIGLSLSGRHEEALDCAQGARAAFIAAGDERAAGRIEINLAGMLSRQDRHAEAAALYRQAAVRFARLGDREHSVMADIGLANALTWLFDFDEALRINERARMRAHQHGLHVLHAHAWGAIGRIELLRGRHHRALPALAEALRRLEQAGAAPQRRIEAEAALADAYLAANLLPEALALHDRVIASATALGAPTELAWATLHRARGLARSGCGDDALGALQQARALFVQADKSPCVAYTDLCLGALHAAAGDGAAALAEAEAAQQALAGSGVVGWQVEAQVLRAEALALLGRHAEARTGFDAALARGADIAPLQRRCHTGIAGLLLAAGQPAEALVLLQGVLDTLDIERAVLPGDDFRSALGTEGEAPHTLLVQAALTLAQAEAVAAPRGAPGGGREAGALLLAIERGRNRAWALGLQAGAPDGTETGDASPMTPGLQLARERWRAAVREGGAAHLSAQDAHVRQAEADLLEAHRRARLQPAAAGAAVPAPTGAEAGLDLAALQAALGPQTALVHYHRQGLRLLAIVVRHDRLHHHVLDATGLDSRLIGLRFQLDSFVQADAALRGHAEQRQQRAQRHLQALHAQLWAPLAAALAGCERVVVVPHEQLHYLPFAALHDGRHWLLEQHELHLAPSAAVWLQQQARPLAPLQAVLALGTTPPGAPALPHLAAELDALAQAFGPPRLTHTLQGPAATLAALRERVGQADVLHLACHGQFRADNPAFSALLLADGPLTLHDTAALRLRASLVVLSACDTGMSRVAPGDELLGLVRAFMLAGAAAVLATLWAVDDAASARLVGRFYVHLAAGRAPAAALRAAQLEQVRTGAHPFLWAAYGLHGRG